MRCWLPLSETLITNERPALEDAISKVEADAMRSEETPPITNGVQTQSDHTEDYTRNAALEASWAPINFKGADAARTALCILGLPDRVRLLDGRPVL